MFTDEEKKSAVQTILRSKEFKDSPVYKNLLKYLADATLSNSIPKEISIAIDVFGKDAAFNSNKDSTVRYHIHMLRKKLNDYYRTEGKSDKIKLVIPTGHYEINFISARTLTAKISRLSISLLKNWREIVIIVLILFVLFLLFHQTQSIQTTAISPTHNTVDVKDEIWGPFVGNGYPICIILGDDFLLDEFNPEYKRYRQIRDWKIDSESDLSAFLVQYPKARLWKSEISGFPFGSTDNLMDILPICYKFHTEVSLLMSSSLTLEEIRDHNIIYIGELKNLRVLNKIIYETPVRFQYHPDERLFIANEKGDTLNTFIRIEAPYEQSNKYNVDYSLLIKMPGFTNENFMFIVGFGYGGRLERTKMLANSALRTEFINEIKKINKTVPEYFIALFEVKSIERTGFSNELKYFKEISRDFFNK
jgi:hypothetical protein